MQVLEWTPHAHHKPFLTTADGLNLLVQAPVGRRIIVHEIQLLNLALQDLWFLNGNTVLEPAFPAFPAYKGFTGQYADEPRWILDVGAHLYLYASHGSLASARGYVKYRFVTNWEGRTQ